MRRKSNRDRSAKSRTNSLKPTNAQTLYERANRAWAGGRLRIAFRLLLAAAVGGEHRAFETLAQFYDFGKGTKPNRRKALYWYRQAYRHGSDSAANNLGCIWRDRKRRKDALLWFRRAIRLGDDDANLNIAKMYLGLKRRRTSVIAYLKRTCRSRSATIGSKEEAIQLLKRLRTEQARST